MKKMIAFALATLVALPVMASAQTIAVSAVVGGEYVQVFDEPSPGTQFPIAVWMDTAGSDANAAEFRVTELAQLGFIKVTVAKINGTQLDLGDNAIGEYLLSFGGCIGYAPQQELVRVTYAAFGADLIPNDYVMSLEGLVVGGDPPSSFQGNMGFVSCSSVKTFLFMGGADGGVTGADVVFPDGGMVIDGTPIVVDNEASSLGQLKARF